MYRGRAVFEIARSLKAFFYLDMGLTRGAVPEFGRREDERAARTRDEQLDQAQRRIESQARSLDQLRTRLSRKEQQLARLSEKDQQLRRLQSQLSLERRQALAVPSETPNTTKSAATEDGLLASITATMDLIPTDFGGGCSLSKAHMMARLMREYELKTTVDIGVYRGRSLFPQALAHHQYTGGVVYGVDPWSTAEAREEDNEEFKEAIDLLVDKTDFQAIYEEVESLRRWLRCEDHCILLRQTSAEAAELFKEKNLSFDLIHIDGNHDTDRVMEDVRAYLPLLNKNGYVILDDISWKSVRSAYDLLASELPLMFERVRQTDDYAVFWNGNSPPDVQERRNFVENAVDDRLAEAQTPRTNSPSSTARI